MRNAKLKLFVCILGIISLLSVALTGCVSATALKIKITSPEHGATVSTSPVTITGKVTGYPRGEVTVGEQTARLIPEVTVNGVKAEVSENGIFSAQVELKEGKNKIEAIAMLNNVEAKDTIKINYTPSEPALMVNIATPEDGAELTENPVMVEGNATAGATVTVNEVEAEVAEDGTFSAEIELVEGENTIEAIATLEGLDPVSHSIKVTYTQPSPELSIEITSPENGAVVEASPITVTGTVSNAEAAVTVNDIVAEVAEDGTFSAEIDLVEGENTIDAVATIEGIDPVSASVTVTYTLPAPVLSIEITEPEDGAHVQKNPITVKGNVTAGAVVTVNEVEAEVAEDGTFSAEVELVEGNNIIEAVAVLGGKEAKDSIVISFVLPRVLNSITITPETPDNLVAGTDQQFTATGTYSDNTSEDITSKVTWASSDTSVATVSETGLVTGVAEGTAEITASLSGINSQPVTVTVVLPEPPFTVQITSPEDGAELKNSLVTVTGIVSDAEATVSVNGVLIANNNGEFSVQVLLMAGQNRITASATLGESQAQDSITLNYNPAPAIVPTVVITSPTNGETINGSTPITVTGTVSPLGAVVSVNGVVVETNNGNFSVLVELVEGENTINAVATLGETQGEDSITVSYTAGAPGVTLTSISVTPDSLTGLKVGDSQQLTATGTYSDNSTADISAEVTWSSSNSAVITVSEAGVASAVAAGNAEITASLSGIVSSPVTVNVVDEPVLSVEITSPEDGVTLTDTTITVMGMVTDPNAQVTVNGVEAMVAEDGSFTAQVEMIEGENTITAIATSGEMEVQDNISVTCNPAA